MYISKVKKFSVCACLRLDSIEENIEGDANLHHPPRNRVKPDRSKDISDDEDKDKDEGQ